MVSPPESVSDPEVVDESESGPAVEPSSVVPEDDSEADPSLGELLPQAGNVVAINMVSTEAWPNGHDKK